MAAADESATLYVIPGSHACRTAMLMLDHKAIAYRRVELITGMHPFAVRMLGFAGHREPIRTVDGRTHMALAMIDRAGTVPALRHGAERIQANIEIAQAHAELTQLILQQLAHAAAFLHDDQRLAAQFLQ